MDGDGEDDPADVPRLLERLEREDRGRIVFAERTRRSESLVFRFFYGLYRGLHHLLTGQKVRVGNFSAIPRRRLSSLVVVSELWNHYAAAVIRSRQPYSTMPTRRAKRLRGRSTMNFVSLVTHGLSAISVQSDVVGVRLFVLSVLLALATTIGIAAAVIVRLTTDWGVPGWATSAVGLLTILLSQAVMGTLVFSFMSLGAGTGRSSCRAGIIRISSGRSGRSAGMICPPHPCRRPSWSSRPPGRSRRGTLSFTYVGTELDLFAAAVRWKSYVRRQVAAHLGRDVLEVGAGHGGTTRVLCDGTADRWVCLEPDSSLADRLHAAIRDGELPDCCRAKIGTLEDLEDADRFDTILYMDVVEHIADDRAELARAAERLRPAGA